MRLGLTYLTAILLLGCSPSALTEITTKEVEVDDRYDLLKHNMPPILVADAKECVKVLTYASIFKFAITDTEKEGFDVAMSAWKQIQSRFLKDISGTKGVLEAGSFIEIPEVIPEALFPKGASKEIKAEKCGEYAGQLQVKIGVVSLSKSVEMVLKVDPEFFEKMDLSTEQVRAGLKIIERRASNLSELSQDNRISCVAIYQGLTLADTNFEPYRNIWVASMSQDIASGALNSMNIAEQSEYWRVLKAEGVVAMSEISNYSEMASMCETKLNDAIKKQAEEA